MARTHAAAAPPVPADAGVTDATFQLFRRAVRMKEQILATYRGQPARLCPHALGWRSGQAYVLGFVILGSGAATPASPSTWQWFRLADLRDPVAQKSFWLTARRTSRPSVGFLEKLDVEAD